MIGYTHNEHEGARWYDEELKKIGRFDKMNFPHEHCELSKDQLDALKQEHQRVKNRRAPAAFPDDWRGPHRTSDFPPGVACSIGTTLGEAINMAGSVEASASNGNTEAALGARVEGTASEPLPVDASAGESPRPPSRKSKRKRQGSTVRLTRDNQHTDAIVIEDSPREDEVVVFESGDGKPLVLEPMRRRSTTPPTQPPINLLSSK